LAVEDTSRDQSHRESVPVLVRATAYGLPRDPVSWEMSSGTEYAVEIVVAPVRVPSTVEETVGRVLYVTPDSVQLPVTGTTVWESVDPAVGSLLVVTWSTALLRTWFAGAAGSVKRR
jgi:hypothetical protein